MLYASSAIYVRKYFQKTDYETVLEIINNLREAFKDMLKINNWMSNKVKEYAIEKV